MPRSARSSSTSRYDNAKRRYQRTERTITSGGKQKPAKASPAMEGRRRRGLMAIVCLLGPHIQQVQQCRLLGGVGTVGIAAVTTNPVVIAAAFLIGGLTNALWNVVAVSLRQRITPDRILGRINSSYRLVAWGTRPLGAAAGGLLGELLGLRAVFGIAAALILATLIGMPQLTDTAISTAEHDSAN